MRQKHVERGLSVIYHSRSKKKNAPKNSTLSHFYREYSTILNTSEIIFHAGSL